MQKIPLKYIKKTEKNINFMRVSLRDHEITKHFRYLKWRFSPISTELVLTMACYYNLIKHFRYLKWRFSPISTELVLTMACYYNLIKHFRHQKWRYVLFGRDYTDEILLFSDGTGTVNPTRSEWVWILMVMRCFQMILSFDLGSAHFWR